MAGDPRDEGVHIGTSGWHYKHWKGPFYPENLPASKMLAHYFQQFGTVEINNSFYRLPSAETFQAWRDGTPDNFLFAVKASRYLTHMKKLLDPERGLDNLLPRVEVLGPKLGPILFQLPPFLDLKLERLRDFLAALPRQRRFVFEFRHPSWHVPAVYDLLRSHNAAFCVFDLAGFHSPVVATADFVYVRLHGPGGKYQGSYTTAVLSGWAERVREFRSQSIEIFIYFDNDENGFAAKNAQKLDCLVQKITLDKD